MEVDHVCLSSQLRDHPCRGFCKLARAASVGGCSLRRGEYGLGKGPGVADPAMFTGLLHKRVTSVPSSGSGSVEGCVFCLSLIQGSFEMTWSGSRVSAGLGLVSSGRERFQDREVGLASVEAGDRAEEPKAS